MAVAMNMLPLEQAVPELFQIAGSRYLEAGQAIQAIRQHPGMIPVAITPAYKLVWLDVGGYRFKEWTFRYSIKNLVDSYGLGRCFSTDIRLLMEDDVLSNPLMPTGFIFHMSQCGSTLMAKALAQPDSHISVSEATPLHENLWRYLTQSWQEPVALTETNLALVRNLILALGRRRLPDQGHYFVKFRSWNVAFVDIIQKAFPEIPCLFMYRDPTEALVSSLHRPAYGQSRLKASGAAAFITGRSSAAIRQMSDLRYFASLYERYLRSGMDHVKGKTVCLNYKQMTKANFPRILEQAFGYTTSAANLSLMQAQFDSYENEDAGMIRFSSGSQEKPAQLTPEIKDIADQHLMAWYQQLEQSHTNLNRVLS